MNVREQGYEAAVVFPDQEGEAVGLAGAEVVVEGLLLNHRWLLCEPRFGVFDVDGPIPVLVVRWRPVVV